jgi:hypothetical protein
MQYARLRKWHRAGCVRSDFFDVCKTLKLNEIKSSQSWHAGCNYLVNREFKNKRPLLNANPSGRSFRITAHPMRRETQHL